MTQVVVSGSFDDLRSQHVRLLHEAARLGNVHVCLWTDAAVAAATGQPPKFPQSERSYLVDAIRFVRQWSLTDLPTGPDALPALPVKPDVWVVDERADTPGKRDFCRRQGIDLRVFSRDNLTEYPLLLPATPTGRKKVLVTGCYDWLHSGHVRFFEECAALGDLYAVVGHDANIRLLKGEGHPLFPEAERQYLVGAIRHVTQALISSGNGWLDAEPEIRRIKPDIYAVNEDGDKPEKRDFCAAHGLQYLVLKRQPKQGLPRRQSTDLRGF